MNGTTHPLAQDYLDRLRTAAQELPPHDRNELLAELRSHLDAAAPPDATDADVRNLLATLGSPDEIVAAARQESDAAPGARPEPPAGARANSWGTREVLGVLCLTVGAFVAPFILPIVGLFLVWTSSRLGRRQKWIVTVVCVVAVAALISGTFATNESTSVGDPVRVR